MNTHVNRSCLYHVYCLERPWMVCTLLLRVHPEITSLTHTHQKGFLKQTKHVWSLSKHITCSQKCPKLHKHTKGISTNLLLLGCLGQVDTARNNTFTRGLTCSTEQDHSTRAVNTSLKYTIIGSSSIRVHCDKQYLTIHKYHCRTSHMN